MLLLVMVSFAAAVESLLVFLLRVSSSLTHVEERGAAERARRPPFSSSIKNKIKASADRVTWSIIAFCYVFSSQPTSRRAHGTWWPLSYASQSLFTKNIIPFVDGDRGVASSVTATACQTRSASRRAAVTTASMHPCCRCKLPAALPPPDANSSCRGLLILVGICAPRLGRDRPRGRDRPPLLVVR